MFRVLGLRVLGPRVYLWALNDETRVLQSRHEGA